MTQATQIESRTDGFLHRRVDVGEVHLHVAEMRPFGALDDAPLVLFLHGFPDFWWTWRAHMQAFARAGYWAVAPDMRGYNESDKPKGADRYTVERLAGDVAGLIGALGRRDAYVVGHDWGGMVAWHFAMLHPDMLKKLAILNIPHPVAMLKGLRRPAQLKKSWYIFMFQLPNIPERFASKDDFAFMRRTFRANRFSADEIERHVDALRVPGALTGMMNYYRASLRRTFRRDPPELRRIDAPVLVVWGDRDRYLGKEMASPPEKWVPDARVVHIADATHWVHRDASEAVDHLLLEFLR
ncbi:MAG TPA: alpha/beta hydrolase [Labilithrix sp.]|jgi:pimeloyl-ACP methyl ester carboxylesterase